MDENNIRQICSECVEERTKVAQKHILLHGLHIGDFVKVPLGKRPNLEHIWAIVQSIEAKTFKCIIDNHPLINKDVKLGDEKEFKIGDIEQVTVPKINNGG